MCVPPRVSRLALRIDDRAPAQARSLLRDGHCPELPEQVLEEALLLVTELVTNAVRHAGPPVRLEVSCGGPSGLGVRVSDGSSHPPAAHRSEPDHESGRGVALVDLLSDAWGVEREADGKTVWFALGDAAHPR